MFQMEAFLSLSLSLSLIFVIDIKRYKAADWLEWGLANFWVIVVIVSILIIDHIWSFIAFILQWNVDVHGFVNVKRGR